MRKALAEAKKAYKAGEVPVGAVIVKNGEIIASAHNSIEKNRSVLCHAETAAIKKAEKILGDWRLDGCDLYVTLEPCPMCAGAIVQSRIRNLYYAVADDKASSREILEGGGYNHKTRCFEGLLSGECLGLLQAFFRERRKSVK
jgi:tRNA(adenine34) deaminase